MANPLQFSHLRALLQAAFIKQTLVWKAVGVDWSQSFLAEEDELFADLAVDALA